MARHGLPSRRQRLEESPSLRAVRGPVLPVAVLSSGGLVAIDIRLCSRPAFRGRVGQWSVAAGEGPCPTRGTSKMLVLAKTGRP